LRDPDHGDFHADLAPGYGCRIIPPAPRAAPPASPRPKARARAPRPARLDVGGPVVVDTMWDADTVRVVADVEVRAGASLTIAPGVRVVGEGYVGLVVRDGDVQAIGSPGEPIVFTASHPELYAEDLDTRGCWNGLTLLNVPAANDSTRLSWCVLEYAKAVPRAVTEGGREPLGGVAIAGAGGALRIIGTDKVRVDHCRLRHNCAERGGAVMVHYGAAPLLVNNLLHDNCGLERAGAVFVTYSYPRFVHDTVAGNRAVNPSIFVNTGGIDHYHSKPVYVGNVVHGNTTNHYENTQVLEPRAYYSRYNLIGGFSEGEGQVVGDPLFQLDGLEPFALAVASPCRDAGSAAEAGAWLPWQDLAGALRVQGPAPDLGAFELDDHTGVASDAEGTTVSLRASPNPANPRVRLTFAMRRAGRVALDIVDLRGQRVRGVFAADLAVGSHDLVWDGRDDRGRPVAAGTYLARLSLPDVQEIRKIAILR
jgi:hypothetical protein